MGAHFSNRELDIMKVLWQDGPSTVAEVREKLADDLAYTTVLTILRTLEGKGHVTRREEGRAHRYAARVKEQTARRTALSRMVDRVFGGSAELLLTQLVEERNLSAEEITRLRDLMNRRLGEERES